MTPIFRGIDSFRLKMTALFFMTVDHLGAYRILTDNDGINNILRIFGRIAAPLFLFLITEGMRHTKSKRKYILRLYIAGVLINLGNLLFREFPAKDYAVNVGNIMPTFMYTALYITCIEALNKTFRDKDKNYRKIILPLAGIIIPLIIIWVYIWIPAFVKIFIPSLFEIDYSIIFVILGIIWYFVDNRKYNCIIFAGLCVFSFFMRISLMYGAELPVTMFRSVYITAWHLFTPSQWCMFLAIPFMSLYNGEKGRKSWKYLFYVYYPSHVWLFAFLQIYLSRR